MLSKKTIKEYDFKTIEDYFNYINLSIINGQIIQAKSLILELSPAQKIEALKFFIELDFNKARSMLIDMM